jgi:hypothetical protein
MLIGGWIVMAMSALPSKRPTVGEYYQVWIARQARP